MWTINRGIRRLLAWGATATAATVAVGLMSSSGASTCVVDGVDQAKPATSSFRIASYNASAQTAVWQTRQDVRKLVNSGADIISLQEMSSGKKRRMIRRRFDTCADCKYQMYIPDEAVPGGLPILYRKDKFDFVKLGKFKATQDTYVGPRGAGPSTLRARWVTWLKLRDERTGRNVLVLNTHGVPTVQRGNGRPNWKLAERVRMYAKHMRQLRDLVTELEARERGAVFVTGDFNVNYRTDRVVSPRVFPHHQLGRVDIQASYEALGLPKRGTHTLPNGFDKRLIDYVHYSTARRWLAPVGQRLILWGFHSDHRPVLVDFEVYAPDCFERWRNTCAG